MDNSKHQLSAWKYHFSVTVSNLGNLGNFKSHRLSLIGGLEHFLFFHILGIVIPSDFHIFQELKPPTKNYVVHVSIFETIPQRWSKNKQAVRSRQELAEGNGEETAGTDPR